jgi:arylformamidase
MNSKNRFIELSHSIENGLITYKGLPAPTICDDLSREASKEKYEDGKGFTQVLLSSFVNLDAIVMRCPTQKLRN